MAKIMRITNKGSWLLVLLLLGFVWHLHSHKKTLHEELSTHKDEKEGLLQQLGHLDSTVAERTKSLQESQRLHSQVSSMAHQHKTELEKSQDELTHMQLVYDECKRTLEEERARAAARKCEDCGPVRTQVTVEQQQRIQLQAEVTQLKTQLGAVTEQLEHMKLNTIPKPVETTTQQAVSAGGVAGGKAAAAADNQRTAHDDHIDAAIAGHGQQTVPTPVVDPKQQQQWQQRQQQQQQQQQQVPPVQQQEGGGQRSWGRGAKVPVAVDASVHQDEHVEPVMTPDEHKLKRRGGGRRKGGLSMLEEHLGVEHDEAEEMHF